MPAVDYLGAHGGELALAFAGGFSSAGVLMYTFMVRPAHKTLDKINESFRRKAGME